MFSKHPKGLVAASLANLGERFGFYTMMAILVLFLQAKFALSGTEAGWIYSTFYFSIYILALVGGVIADKTRNYKGTILIGIVLISHFAKFHEGSKIIFRPFESLTPMPGCSRHWRDE